MKRAKKPKGSGKVDRFVAEYIIDLNATQAAIRAGYSQKTAYSQGQRLLKKAEVQESLAKAKAARTERTEITQDRVLAELALLAFSDHTHYQVDEKGNVSLSPDAPQGAHRAISSVKRRIHSIALGEGEESSATTAEVEIKLWDKPGMLRLAGRHVGLFPDRMELTGKDGQPLDSQVARVTFVLPDNGRRVASQSEGDGGGGEKSNK